MRVTMYYNVVDCEHEGDVDHAINELRKIADITVVGLDYEYEDDEDADADHEICGCTISFVCDEQYKKTFEDFGAFL